MLVTGGASGLGAATVGRLVGRGCAGGDRRSARLARRGARRRARRAGALRGGRRTRRGSGAGGGRRGRRAGHAAGGGQLRRGGHPGPGDRQARRAATGGLPDVVEINLVGTFNVLRLAAAGHDRQRAARRRPRAGDHDRERRGVRRADRSGGVRGQQGWHRRADPDCGQRPGRQGDPGDDHRPRRDGDPDDGRPAGRHEVDPGGAGAAPAPGWAGPRSTPCSSSRSSPTRCSTARSSGSTAPYGCRRASAR